MNHIKSTPTMGNTSTSEIMRKFLELNPAEQEITEAAIDAMLLPETGDNEDLFPRSVCIQWGQANDVDTAEAWAFVEGIMYGLHTWRHETRKDFMFLFTIALERRNMAKPEAVAYGECVFERDRTREELNTLTVQFGFALETIRTLIVLAESAGHEKATAAKVARRFLAEVEEVQP